MQHLMIGASLLLFSLHLLDTRKQVTPGPNDHVIAYIRSSVNTKKGAVWFFQKLRRCQDHFILSESFGFRAFFKCNRNPVHSWWDRPRFTSPPPPSHRRVDSHRSTAPSAPPDEFRSQRHFYQSARSCSGEEPEPTTQTESH